MSTEPLATPPAPQTAQQVAQQATDAEWGWVPVALTGLEYAILVATGLGVAFKYLREDGIVVGFVLGGATAARAFWFGTSRSSEKNGAVVRQMATSPPPSTLATTVTEGTVTTDVKTG
jgi:hypothetical protein